MQTTGNLRAVRRRARHRAGAMGTFGAGIVGSLLIACGSNDGQASGVDGGNGGGAIGTPCTPTAEYQPNFDGFDLGSINTEVRSPGAPSGAPVCLAYHFQGRVTCPYGQDASGKAPAGASPCVTPDSKSVTGMVFPQCSARPAAKVVFWSCRCANVQGRTDDGSSYCACPSSMTCTQVVSSIGAVEDDISGAYCLPAGVAYDPNVPCLPVCDPSANPCS
jgi:hypothetical protein